MGRDGQLNETEPEAHPEPEAYPDKKRKRRNLIGYACLVASFPPYFVMLWLATLDDPTQYMGVMTALLIFSNILWYSAIALLGKEAIHRLRARLRRKKRDSPTEPAEATAT